MNASFDNVEKRIRKLEEEKCKVMIIAKIKKRINKLYTYATPGCDSMVHITIDELKEKLLLKL